MSVKISRQHWQALLLELDDARRKRHLLTYRALVERLELPTPGMQTLTAALEYLAGLDARAERPLRSALVISQGASRLPRTGFFDYVAQLGRFSGPFRWYRRGVLARRGSGAGIRIRLPRGALMLWSLARPSGLSAGAAVARLALAGQAAAGLAVAAGAICAHGRAR